MAQKIIVEHRNQGCVHGCLTVFVWMFVIGLAIAVLAYVGVIAAGIGLWFLIRYVWRQYVQQKPESGLVRRGLQMAPITRKILAGVLCAIVTLCLLGVVSSMAQKNQANKTTGQTQEQSATNDKQSEKSAEKSGTSDSTDKTGDAANADKTGSTADTDSAAKVSSEQSVTRVFDLDAYSLKVEVKEPKAGLYKTIISVYGYSDADYATMRQCIIDAAECYGLAEDADTVGTEFDSIIGSEGGSGATWDDGGIITSAPNESENFYRADLYVKQ